jgi:cytochrome c biogenesis protein CcmG/thiol:disulfide interchange protein DsbE
VTPVRRTRSLAAAALAVAAMVSLVACASAPSKPASSAVGASSPSAGTCVTPADDAPANAPAPIADLALPCFAGGGDIRPARLGRPTVINLWASWCAPCRTELPALESYAKRVGDAVTVLGVITADSRPAAQSVVDDLHLTIPMLYDRDRRLLRAVEKVNLPVTLFLRPDGQVAFTYNGTALDTEAFIQLTGQYLGVVIS